MNENIDLSKILKGYEGETFYSRCFGNVILIDHVDLQFKASKEHDEIILEYYHKGNYSENGEQDLFPSKDQRDWNKWNEENNPKIPKTWSDYIIVNRDNFDKGICDYCIDVSGTGSNGWTRRNTPIKKSALALIKIHQLIEAGYGGNITNEDYINNDWKYIIIYSQSSSKLEISRTCKAKYNHIAFHTEAQAEEFLKYPENVQLLKDYFMI